MKVLSKIRKEPAGDRHIRALGEPGVSLKKNELNLVRIQHPFLHQLVEQGELEGDASQRASA